MTFNYTFQQDGAPAYRARDTVQLLTRETPDFIPPSLWPPNSPDLNPVDYYGACSRNTSTERISRLWMSCGSASLRSGSARTSDSTP